MEKATEVSMRESLRKRHCPGLEVESSQRLADEEHGERSKQFLACLETLFDEFGRKTDLPTESQNAAAEEEDEDEDEDEDDDDPDRQAVRYRKRWNSMWSEYHGSFEHSTLIPSMRYTIERPPQRIDPCHTLQIFSVKIAEIGGGFQWPLDVYGLVATRDSVDQNRNIVFQRLRFECQTLTEKDPYLVLTGPTRAVALVDPVNIEVYLKVKGRTQLEDKTLCFLAEDILSLTQVHSCLLHRTWTSKFSTLEFTLGHIIFSVEATIFVRVVDGSWPDGFHGQFAACMVSSIGHHCEAEVPILGRTTSVNHKKIILLGFGDGKLPVMVGGSEIQLARCVVSAEVGSKLKVFVKAWQDQGNILEAVTQFTAKEAGSSFGTLDIGPCKIDVIVAWSLVSSDPEPH